MAKVFEELVCARKGGAKAHFSARREQLGVDVSFILRNHDVLGPVKGGLGSDQPSRRRELRREI